MSQPLLLVLLLASVVVSAILALRLIAARRRVRECDQRPAGSQITRRELDQPEGESDVLGWITNDFLRFIRHIHSPIKVREIPRVLKKFIGSTFDPAAGAALAARSFCSSCRAVRPARHG